MGLFRSLGYRSFAFLWTGQTISRFGDSLHGIALAWWVLQKTGSATEMGAVLIFSMVPSLLFSLIGGVAVDRFPRIRVLLISDVLRGLVVSLVALLAFTNLLEIWHVYFVSIIFGLVGAFFQPAYIATIPQIVPGDALPSANSLTSLSGEFIGIVGPALGASVVALGGSPTAFAIDGLSFFISAACLIAISQSPPSPGRESGSASVVRDLRAGIGAVLASPWLWITIALASFGNITIGGPLAVALPFLIKGHLHADVGALGLVYSMQSVGAFASSVWLGRHTRLQHRGLTAYCAWIVAALMILVIGLSPSVVVVSLAGLVISAALSAFNLIWMNTVQELVPPELLGRVSSIDFLGSFAFMPIGYGAAGWATDQIGAPMVFAVGGVCSMGLGALGLLHPAIRGLD